jgi:hypothetical protein
VAECNVLVDYRQRLITDERATGSREEIFHQLRLHPPLAVIEGYWVTAVDLVRAFERMEGADSAALPAEEPGEVGTLPYLVALAFVPQAARDQIPLPSVGPLERFERPHEPDIDPETSLPEILVVPAIDAANAFLEYLPPPYPVSETEEPPCYYFCGDPSEWDFDADGVPNATDPDDDGDESPDAEDAFPYWPGGASCDCGESDFVGFTEKFSREVAAGIVSAYERLRRSDRQEQWVSFGTRVEESDLWLVSPSPDECRAPISECPDAEAPGVRYVSRDPAACALIRYRCEEGEVGFSDECGCGCRPPE